MKDKIATKVRRLLALAQSDNVHEAQLALLRAQEYMVKHGLSMVDVEDAAKVTKEVSEVDTLAYGRIPWYWDQLLMIVADNFRCYTLWRKNRGTQKLVLIGLKHDARLAFEIYQETLAWLDGAVDAVRGKYRSLGVSRVSANGFANDYVQGFMAGLKEMFKQQVAQHG